MFFLQANFSFKSLDPFSYYSNQLSLDAVKYFKQNSVNLMYIICLYLGLCISFYYVQSEILRTKGRLFQNVKRVLFVTAHPDDECMFFAPAIVKLQQQGSQIFILCLSTGNAGNLGDKRKQELWNACEILGIPASNILLIKSPHMPDDRTIRWEQNYVARLIHNVIEVYETDTVITFDRDGVSGHPNHCSLFYAVATLCMEGVIPTYCRVYLLESVNLVRMYSMMLDGPFSYLLSSFVVLVTNKEKSSIIKRAVEMHQTQTRWFSFLLNMFSRYMYFNTFKELEPGYVQSELDLELEMYSEIFE